MDSVTIGCASDISNAFTLAQHNLSREFEHIEGISGVFDGMIPDGGTFPLNTGFAARTTTLAQQRLNYEDLNLWQPMVGLQDNCDTSCQPPTKVVNFVNAQHNWYRLFWIAYNSPVYCLTQMFADHLNIEEQIAQVFMDLKFISVDLNDEWSRTNHVALAQNRWMGISPTTGNPSLTKGDWSFATDANGFTDTSVIILAAGVDPNEVSLLSVSGFLNYIRNQGTYIKTFSANGEIPLLTDYQTFQDLPLRDTNQRADNRFRQPGVLNPEYAATTHYAGYSLHNDYFALRYNYYPNHPDYPGQTVLVRVNPWSNTQISEGCWSNVSDEYQNASFQVSVLWGGSTFKQQIGVSPKSAGSGTVWNNPQMPFNGMNWEWKNEVNEVTPANQDRNLGYWRMVAERAAKPVENGVRGHIILHRLFPFNGITGTCAELQTPSTGSTDCTLTCPAMDFFPPPLEEYTTCGCWNEAGLCEVPE